MKRFLEKLVNFYEMQDPSARIFLITITAISAICLIWMVVNLFYYGV